MAEKQKFCDKLYALILKANLDGTTFAYDCRMRFPECTLLASCKKITHNSCHSTLPIPTIFKKSYDIFYDVHDSRKRVVGLIYTKQFVL